jgi:hypothetical protein
MTNYYTEFSTAINDITQEQREWIEKFLKPPMTDNFETDLERWPHWINWMRLEGFPNEMEERILSEGWPVFGWEIEEDSGSTHLWIHSDDGSNIDNVAIFAQAFLSKFSPDHTFSMEWSNGCSKPIVDAFGGGAFVATAQEVFWWNTWSWANKKKKEIEEVRKKQKDG